MAQCKKYIFLLILIFAYKSVRANTIKDIKESLSTLWDGITGLRDIAKYFWSGVENSQILDQHSPSDEINSPIADFETDEKKQIRQQLKFLAAQGDELLIDVHAVKDVIKDKLVQNVAGLHDLNQRLSEVYNHLYKIDKTYDSFEEYVTAKPGTYDLELLSTFAKDIVSAGSCGIKGHIVQMSSLIYGQDSGLRISNTIDLLLQNFELFSQYTKIKQSQQQLLYNFLAGVLWTELKAYVVVHFAYYILQVHEKRNYDSHMKMYEKEFMRRNTNTLRAFKTAMKSASREYSKGDPNVHVEGDTYVRLNNVFQFILLSKMDINQDDACYNTCYHETYRKKNYVTNCYDGKLCKAQRACAGDIVQCGYYIKNDLEVCLSKNPTSNRRYDYVTDGDGVKHGSKQKCEGNTITAESIRYSNLQFWKKNDICTCICADKKNSDRFFSLHVAKARYEENYVITGVRFVKKNNIVHLQVQEGQLLPGGVINDSTIHWVPLPENVVELYAIEWKKSTGIELDDINTGYKDQAIVAIQLKANGKEYKHLTFQISSLHIDHGNGKVIQDSLKNITAPRSENRFPLVDYELPTRFIEKNTKKAGRDMFVAFVPSGINADVGQNLVPFIDTQEIVTVPSAPISGLGLYLRYVKNSGGFLAPRIFTYDYEYNLKAEEELIDDHRAYYEDLYDVPYQNFTADFIES